MNLHQLEDIIQIGESESIEFKSNFNNEVIESLVAFANTKGGSVFIGVNARNQIKGVQVNPESVQNWVNEIKNKTSPPLLPDVELVEFDTKKHHCLKNSGIPYKTNIYKREIL
jgi:ATP-dependent DNA helicase RecG